MRGKQAPKRDKTPDLVYHSTVIQELINKVMQDGKMSTAKAIVYDAFAILKEQTKKESIEVFNKALDSIRPTVELRSRRVGGANYQVPMPVTKERGSSLAIKWVVTLARKARGKNMAKKLAKEFIDAYNNTGEAIAKKENTHKMAEANKAFAIFRW